MQLHVHLRFTTTLSFLLSLLSTILFNRTSSMMTYQPLPFCTFPYIGTRQTLDGDAGSNTSHLLSARIYLSYPSHSIVVSLIPRHQYMLQGILYYYHHQCYRCKLLSHMHYGYYLDEWYSQYESIFAGDEVDGTCEYVLVLEDDDNRSYIACTIIVLGFPLATYILASNTISEDEKDTHGHQHRLYCSDLQHSWYIGRRRLESIVLIHLVEERPSFLH